MSKQKGFAPILILLGLAILVAVAGGTYYLGIKKAVTPVPAVISPSSLAASPSPQLTPSPTSNIFNGEKIEGTAYMSPNPGEGLSVQYTQTVDRQTYHPFIPLTLFVDSDTKIINSTGQVIQLKDILVGDNLVVYKSEAYGMMSIRGGTGGGIKMKIYSIQDLSR